MYYLVTGINSCVVFTFNCNTSCQNLTQNGSILRARKAGERAEKSGKMTPIEYEAAHEVVDKELLVA